MHKYPLLTKETLDKEVHNIHSEFMISYNSEIRRVNEILCENMDDKHPFNVFGAGNLTTLRDVFKSYADDKDFNAYNAIK